MVLNQRSATNNVSRANTAYKGGRPEVPLGACRSTWRGKRRVELTRAANGVSKCRGRYGLFSGGGSERYGLIYGGHTNTKP